jgi:glycosyltransferase involved in cell wall biosynthesis
VIDELSIIIPALNEEKYLPRLLQSITEQNYKGKLEVIVVDGGSNDTTIKTAEQFKSKISDLQILTTDRNIGHQRNVGAGRAIYKYLLFLDADVILAKDCLNTIHKKDPKENFVANAFHSSDHLYFTDYFFFALIYIAIFFWNLIGFPVTNGDFLLTSKSNHNKIKGFKEGAVLGEDTDYGIRSIRSGAKYYFFFKKLVYGSDRRIRKAGRIRVGLIWARAFLHVITKGPIYDKSSSYSFEHYR